MTATYNEKCKTCVYFLHHYYGFYDDGFCDLKKLRVNPFSCSCAYWTKERINGLGDVE